MTLKDQLDALLDATAFDSTGVKIGAVRQVYVDDASGKITFATVSTGIFSSDAIVPLHGARLLDDELHVDHTRSVIRDSPRPDHTEDALAPDQEVKLLEYYGIDTPAVDTRKPDQPRTAAPATRSAPAATTSAAPAAPTTSAATATSTTPSAPPATATPATPAAPPAGAVDRDKRTPAAPPAGAVDRDKPGTDGATDRPKGGTRAD